MRRLAACLTASLLLAACSAPVVSPEAPATPPLAGVVEGASERQAQATLGDIANGATISIIEPASGNTVATTLTTPDGGFRFNFKNEFKPGSKPYFLEAMKGLRANSAGAPLIRLRTLITYRSGRWLSLSGAVHTLSRSSSALSALSNLKALTDDQNASLMGCLTTPATDSPGIEIPAAFVVPAGLSGLLDVPTYEMAWAVVDRAIAQDQDPIAGLYVRAASASAALPNGVTDAYGLWDGFGLTADGFVFSSLSAATIARGGTLKLYGHGLPRTTSGATVTLGVGGPACTVTAASADGTSLSVQIPLGISTGAYALQLIYGKWTATKNVTVN
ncbi:hypothetical protein J7643_16780 [bacterium]|nr:hypothetical protein [bacterium]